MAFPCLPPPPAARRPGGGRRAAGGGGTASTCCPPSLSWLRRDEPGGGREQENGTAQLGHPATLPSRRAGSKKRVPAFLLKANAEGWLAVVPVEYRFTYVAVRDERADPAAEDPVARQSSRVLFAIPFAGPTDWTLLGRIAHGHPAYRQLIGYAPGTPVNEMAADRIKDVSPVSFVTPDDPPMLLVHGDADRTVPIEHARALEAALKKAGVEVELDVIKDGTHAVAGAGPAVAARASAYMRERLGAPRM